MKRFLILPLMLLTLIGAPLAGCGTFGALQTAVSTVTETKVDPDAVYVARNAFAIVEVTATKYLRLRRCSATSGPVCRSPAVTAQIIPAVRSGIAARKELVAFMKRNPGQLGTRGAYDALVSATSALKQIYGQYNIEGDVQ